MGGNFKLNIKIIIFVISFTKILANSISATEKQSIDTNKLNKNYSLPRIRRNAFSVKFNSNEKLIVESSEKQSVNNTQFLLPRPRFASSRNLHLPMDPSIYKCNDKLSINCANKTRIYRDKLLMELKKSLSEIIDEPNYYHVDFIESQKMESSICLLINANIRTLRQHDSKLLNNKIFSLFPKRKFIGRKFYTNNSCVIVSSAGSMVGSNLGKFIDSHDIVLRFNHAPIEGYQSDVGTKTTIRVINSQVVSKSEFNFLETSLFQNITIAAWDPGKYNGTLTDWFLAPDFNLFSNYEKFMLKSPDANFYIIDPRSIWKLWTALRIFTGNSIRRNPPSSGFIGLGLLLPLCSYVDFIEYIPSTRLNGRCHYYDPQINPLCTFGAWHPLAAEKLMTYNMNIAGDFTVFQNGILRIQRPHKNTCNNNKII